MKNHPKRDISFQLPHFTIFSLMVFPFEKFLNDNLRSYGLIDAVHFLENVLLDIFKNVVLE